MSIHSSSLCERLARCLFLNERFSDKAKNTCIISRQSKGKVQIHARTGHDGPQAEKRNSPALSLTSLLFGGVGRKRYASAVLPQKKKRLGDHCTGGGMGPGAGLERCGKFRRYRGSIPALSGA